ncbi:MAG: methylmalonyl-CoA mutase family protein [Cryomorphaceae bacterium]|nr:methylmalonyl-CoA mutase family protein [Cryomorphaceae bacterium]
MSKALDFSEFSSLSKTQWLEKIKRETGVESIDELTTKVFKNTPINPLHTSHAFEAPLPSEKSSLVLVHPHGNISNEKDDNIRIIKALEGGANGVYLTPTNKVKWPVLLNDVVLDYITLYVVTNNQSACEDLEAYIAQTYPEKNPLVFYDCRGFLHGHLRTGCRSGSINLMANEDLAPATRIALAIAQSHELIQNGKPVEQLWYALPTVGHYFLDIIQIRALRQLHQFLLETCKIEPTHPDIFVKSRLDNKSSDDEYQNMVKNTAEAMGAIVGGANALCIAPHNVHSKPNDPFGLRIARNIQLILQYEAHIDGHIDPASGSHFFEKQTIDMAKEAWNLFRDIEKGGGYMKMANNRDILAFLKTHKNA